MKKVLFLLLVNLFALNLYSEKYIASGYYVNLNKDTIKCKFSLKKELLTGEPDTLLIQYKIVVLDSLNNETKYFPSDIKGFFINYNGKNHIYHSVENSAGFTIGEPYLFLELISNGYLKWYTFKYFHGLNIKSTSPIINVDGLKKGNEPVVKFLNFGFDGWGYYKRLSEYFLEYPDLSDKILNKEYKDDDMKIIVQQYNKWKSSGSIVVIDTTIYTNVDVMPLFLFGGKDNTLASINDYFYPIKNIPSNCPRKSKVFFQAVIERDGSVSNIKILRGIPDNTEFNNSLIEKVRTMPKWTIGLLNNKKVRVSVSFLLIVN